MWKFKIQNLEIQNFLISGPKNFTEHMWIEVGNEIIWESQCEQLLGTALDKKLKFEAHLKNICRKTSAKVTALARLAKLLPLAKKRTLMNSFIESQFSHCPLVWMFWSRTVEKKINRIHEKALRIVYLDVESSYFELLAKDEAVTMHHHNIQLVAIEMFKVINDIGPSIMCKFTI